MDNGRTYIKNLKMYEKLSGWKRVDFSQALEQWSISYNEKVAIISNEGKVTYRELQQRVTIVAGKLLKKGIKKGENVILQLPNRISFVVYMFALTKIGAIPIMALPAHRETELSGLIELAKPVAYIVADKYLGFSYVEMAMKLQSRYACLEHIIIDQSSDVLNFKNEVDEVSFPEIDPYNTAILLLSGGTTGIPKLIPRTHADYLYDAKKASEKCRLNSETVFLAVLPIPHNFSLGNPGILGTLMHGGTIIMASTTSPDEIFPLIEEYGVTVMGLVPSLVSLYLETLEWDDSYDISSLQAIWVGGAVFEESLARRVKPEFGCKLQQVFGIAEGLNCYTDLDDPEDIICTCQGKPISEADEIKIVDENDIEVSPGQYGELLVRGPYTIDGYYKRPDANMESFTNDGFYRTGDRMMLTLEGNIRAGGRVKEQINKAGEKIMPAEIEGYLAKSEKIVQAAVVGVSDAQLGNRICAFIMTRDNESISYQEIIKYLKDLGIAQYKLPDQIEVIDIWPLTSVGKIDKLALIKMAEQTRG